MGDWKHEEWKFEGKGGVSLHGQAWIPPEYRAALIVVHGLGEHSGRYLNIVDHFCPRGFAVFGYDHRGFGKSEGTRAFTESIEDFLDDLDTFVRATRARTGGKPLVVIGHSMGGLIVLRWASTRNPAVEAVISSGAAVEVGKPVPRAKLAAARIFSRLAPRLSMANEVDPKALSHDEAVVQAYIADPLVYRNITARLAHEIIRSMGETLPQATGVRVPLLLLHGEADSIVAASGTRKFHEATTAPRKELHLYAGFYHEIFNEVGKENVFKDMETWLGGVIGGDR
jgi:alpha-beta hydrolase superfamily lysophospholipase